MKLTQCIAVVALLCSSCAFHSGATQWNSRMGLNGRPVHIKTTTSVGLNIGIILKLFGATDINGLVDELTAEIAAEGGDNVRVIQSSSENYWYGFPPFTWILTPVITTVAADYEPTTEALQEAAEKSE